VRAQPFDVFERTLCDSTVYLISRRPMARVLRRLAGTLVPELEPVESAIDFVEATLDSVEAPIGARETGTKPLLERLHVVGELIASDLIRHRV
jgi:hypothetical protein